MIGMAEMPDNYFELAIVDPPYGIGVSTKKSYHLNSLTKYKPKKWDSNIPDKKYFDELFRVSKNQIVWGANYFVKFLKPSKNWIVWNKKQPEGVSFSMHELAFYSGNGQAKMFTHSRSGNCVSNNPEKAQQYMRIHPTQKPIALYRWLLQNYAKKGDKTLDTHVGSGSSLIACIEEGHEYVGYELDADYFRAATKRIEEFKAQGRLF